MSETVKVRILAPVGDPKTGVIIRSGTVAELPRVWAERYVSEGRAERFAEPPRTEPKKKKR